MFRYVILFFLIATAAEAQNVSNETLRWDATGFRDLDSGVDFMNRCQFVTYGKERVKWIQDDGKEVVEWKISETIGTWEDVKVAGSYQYIFKDGNLNGEITMKRISSGLLIKLVIIGGTSDIRLEYVISAVEKL
jgi:hypothetical protein